MIKSHARFCQRLKQARLALDIKQQQVAAYLQVPVSAVSAFESGKRRLDAWELYQLSKLYSKSIQWFFDDEPLPSVPAASSERLGRELLPPRESMMFEEPQLLECLMLMKRAPRHLRQKAVQQVLKFFRTHQEI
ncbi:MAG: helix-turn-helix domain-containing protein [Vampirovibrionales bacterium]|nr:helix-turn-helix domain-containing protein [Vampirovibrionales bacterium]